MYLAHGWKCLKVLKVPTSASEKDKLAIKYETEPGIFYNVLAFVFSFLRNSDKTELDT